LRERSELFEHEKKKINKLKKNIREKVTGFISKLKLELNRKINIKMVELSFRSKIQSIGLNVIIGIISLFKKMLF